MQHAPVAASLFLCLCGLTGCRFPNTLEGFKSPGSGGLSRAAFELQCPEGQLSVVDLGDNTMGVTGCGKRAVYKYSASGWVSNSAAIDTKGGTKGESPQPQPQP